MSVFLYYRLSCLVRKSHLFCAVFCCCLLLGCSDFLYNFV
jgi:hypothetical protein